MKPGFELHREFIVNFSPFLEISRNDSSKYQFPWDTIIQQCLESVDLE